MMKCRRLLRSVFFLTALFCTYPVLMVVSSFGKLPDEEGGFKEENKVMHVERFNSDT
jgi:hypothetical protein